MVTCGITDIINFLASDTEAGQLRSDLKQTRSDLKQTRSELLKLETKMQEMQGNFTDYSHAITIPDDYVHEMILDDEEVDQRINLRNEFAMFAKHHHEE